MNILLLEDDELTLKFLSHHLTEKGHKVYPAINGNEAIDIVLDNPIDLIICDLMVPILSGVSFLSSRGKFMSLDVPVIAMSSLKDGEAMLKNLFIDFGFFIAKPVDLEKLMELVELCEQRIKDKKSAEKEIG
jgi:two-component system capsular synthesis sensor histidine kinase RcsC